MPVCVGPSASAVHIAPTLTLNSSTNYNQNSGVLNATVSATGNRAITSVEFQWSTSSSFASGNSAWTVASTNTTIGQGTTGTTRTVTATGLTENNYTGTPYYVRFRTTNSSGFVTTSSIGGSFTTYRKIAVAFTGSSTWSNPVPSSGTSGLAITGLLNLEARAGGGAGDYQFATQGGGGGGAGARTTASSASISGNVTVTVGAGGAAYSNGGATSIGSVLSAAGGINPYSLFANDGGASGNGNAGGIGRTYEAGGGGGGTNGVGGNASGSSFPWTPGAGGAGWTSGYGEGGAGGNLSNTAPVNGGAYTGNGGTGSSDGYSPKSEGFGGSGYAYFEYWGP
jgi:hypothetical protein